MLGGGLVFRRHPVERCEGGRGCAGAGSQRGLGVGRGASTMTKGRSARGGRNVSRGIRFGEAGCAALAAA